ncbi:class I SAM-dependent methyltransferase [Candidatus Latescibacterota bacterium]
MYRIGTGTVFVLAMLLAISSTGLAQTENDNREFADRFSKTAVTALAPVYGPLADYLVDKYALGSRVGVGIDIGGGPGSLSVELAGRTNGMSWINSDINPSFFPHTAEKAKIAGVEGRVSFIAADVHCLPFRDNFADIIVSRGSFQFWEDIDKAFAEIYRVLKPGCPAFIGRGFTENLPVGVARDIRKRHGSGPAYDKHETAAMLEEIARARGFRDYRIILPEPSGAEGVNYGVWIEFFKE